jgi:hypothetical protein
MVDVRGLDDPAGIVRGFSDGALLPPDGDLLQTRGLCCRAFERAVLGDVVGRRSGGARRWHGARCV